MSNKYYLNDDGLFCVGGPHDQMDRLGAVEELNQLHAENERLKIVERSALENQKVTEIYKNECERLKDQYESTPARALKALLELHNHAIYAQDSQPELMDMSTGNNQCSPVGYYITAEDIEQ